MRCNAGTCEIGEKGKVCRDGLECKKGHICGWSRKCVGSAEGQRCLSDFWCLEGTQCSKKSQKCTSSVVPPEDRFPATPRSNSCSSMMDCAMHLRCFNGVCVPEKMGTACTNSPIRPESHMRCTGGVQVVGTAVRPCNSSYQCFHGLTCRFGRCAPIKLGDECDELSGCPPLSLCHYNGVRSICSRPGRGEKSKNSKQCKGNLRCVQHKRGGGGGL